jgi:hypothetical protein
LNASSPTLLDVLTEYGIFYFQKFGTSQRLSRINPKQLPATSTINSEPSCSPLGVSPTSDVENLCNSPSLLPLPPVSNRDSPNSKTSAPLLSPVPPNCTSSRCLYIQRTLAETTVTMQHSQIMVSDVSLLGLYACFVCSLERKPVE